LVVRQFFLEFAGETIFRSGAAGTVKKSTGGIVPDSLQGLAGDIIA
jgi:hypothetical protein